MSPSRRISLAFGVLFLITFITSIGALIAFQPVLDDPAGYVAGDGSDNRIYFGALLELLLIIANIGTTVVVFPILRRQNEILALGYVTARKERWRLAGSAFRSPRIGANEFGPFGGGG